MASKSRGGGRCDSSAVSGLEGKREPRLGSRVQNDRREAKALAMGAEGESDVGVEEPERSEGAGDEDRGTSTG